MIFCSFGVSGLSLANWGVQNVLSIFFSLVGFPTSDFFLILPLPSQKWEASSLIIYASGAIFLLGAFDYPIIETGQQVGRS